MTLFITVTVIIVLLIICLLNVPDTKRERIKSKQPKN